MQRPPVIPLLSHCPPPLDPVTPAAYDAGMGTFAIFVTDGIEDIPFRDTLHWFRRQGMEPTLAGVPGVGRVFLQGAPGGLDVVALDTWCADPAAVLGLVLPESPTVRHEVMRPVVTRCLEQLEAAGTPLLTWGGGIIACAFAGRLVRRHVAGPHESIPDLLRTEALVDEEAVVVDWPWITARSAIDLPRALQAAFSPPEAPSPHRNTLRPEQ